MECGGEGGGLDKVISFYKESKSKKQFTFFFFFFLGGGGVGRGGIGGRGAGVSELSFYHKSKFKVFFFSGRGWGGGRVLE